MLTTTLFLNFKEIITIITIIIRVVIIKREEHYTPSLNSTKMYQLYHNNHLLSCRYHNSKYRYLSNIIPSSNNQYQLDKWCIRKQVYSNSLKLITFNRVLLINLKAARYQDNNNKWLVLNNKESQWDNKCPIKYKELRCLKEDLCQEGSHSNNNNMVILLKITDNTHQVLNQLKILNKWANHRIQILNIQIKWDQCLPNLNNNNHNNTCSNLVGDLRWEEFPGDLIIWEGLLVAPILLEWLIIQWSRFSQVWVSLIILVKTLTSRCKSLIGWFKIMQMSLRMIGERLLV